MPPALRRDAPKPSALLDRLLHRLPVVTRRRLHRGHFAYLRAVLQGVAPRIAAPLYVPEAADPDAASAADATAAAGAGAGAAAARDEADLQPVHRLTGWIRAELCAAAARGGNFARATLLRLDLAPGATALPTLAAFAAAQGLEEFSEGEQLAAYQMAFGTALDQQRRRTALLRRQLLAIHQLEATMAAPVGLDDGVQAWFTDAIAARLTAHGLRTLAELHARVAADPRWWRAVAGIGAGKARAIRQFLSAHTATLGGLPEAAPGRAPASAPAGRQAPPAADSGTASGVTGRPDGTATAFELPAPSPLMPMTRLVLPAELDGRTGRFRAPRELCLIDAPDDRAAIASWLAVRAPSLQPSSPEASSPGAPARRSHTYEAYRKEAERLLLWCVIERRRALSSLTPEDGAAYLAFLQAPPPAWCGPRNVPRWAVGWRPLEGALSARSVGYAASVLGNLFAFLVTQNYLVGNPFRAVRVPVRIPRGPDPGRGLSHELWAHVAAALDRLPAGLASQRLQVALHLLYGGGLRLAELVAARTDDLEHVTLRQADGTPVTGWLLRTVGKGQKVRLVPVPDAWIDRLGRYLVARGLPGDPRLAAQVPILGVVRGVVAADIGVTGSALHGQLKRFFAGVAQRLDASEPALAARLRQASAHWLRHTCINHSLDGGLPVELVQQNVGHASLDTTTAYVRTEDARRLAAMHKLWQSPPASA
ncbi:MULTISPECIES: phage integrase family protein [Cupriavidus]|uniref:Site-specific integrase n=1 Tax=Cupriavidus campinensis TaxID=151783 RepID=A0AAE9L3U4_9BURK|nr:MULTISPECIES: phage integrase family protein [Cupriavidus]MCM3606191.1 site-specific integrase [Cupriavidus pauculus]MCA3187218.1 tyrosine-type recombinase/integrase [Cupriavidus sp.]MCA3192115.1 tyrosine-type recombinase/integrase [Cupriavidus sp.]MCA3197860.1 tyrosine-type recombinase/integrase [Cupriavidus sp.]MCA3206463.1 tyrosine-type recombinase/integrase [Cupriavidus sp.]